MERKWRENEEIERENGDRMRERENEEIERENGERMEMQW